MDTGYIVTKRSPAGQAREIGCRQHPDCTWTFAAPAQRDDDPVFQAMFAQHMERRSDPGRAAAGHERRRKR
jgi:hypothetical protein